MASAETSSSSSDSISIDSADTIDLYGSGESDGHEDGQVRDRAEAIQPYRFEPLRRVDDAEQAEAHDDGDVEGAMAIDRVGNVNWCTCGNCIVMGLQRDCICCQEYQVLKDKLSQGSGSEAVVACVTNHPGFEVVCLNQHVLDTAFYQYRQEHGHRNQRHFRIDEKYRYIGYRQFVRWCWGWLGWHVRYTLPSCVVNKIRTTNPAPDGIYMGYQDI